MTILEADLLLEFNDVIIIIWCLSTLQVPGSISVWVKKLSTGSLAIGVLNKNNEGTPVPFKTSFADLGFSNKNGYSLTEVFENKPIGKYQLTQQFVIYVEPTSCFLVTATPL